MSPDAQDALLEFFTITRMQNEKRCFWLKIRLLSRNVACRILSVIYPSATAYFQRKTKEDIEKSEKEFQRIILEAAARMTERCPGLEIRKVDIGK